MFWNIFRFRVCRGINQLESNITSFHTWWRLFTNLSHLWEAAAITTIIATMTTTVTIALVKAQLTPIVIHAAPDVFLCTFCHAVLVGSVGVVLIKICSGMANTDLAKLISFAVHGHSRGHNSSAYCCRQCRVLPSFFILLLQRNFDDRIVYLQGKKINSYLSDFRNLRIYSQNVSIGRVL